MDFKFFKVRVAFEELLVIRDAVILDPIVEANNAIRKSAHMSLPIADQKIEVMRSGHAQEQAIHLLLHTSM
jgi:hypothetical protein